MCCLSMWLMSCLPERRTPVIPEAATMGWLTLNNPALRTESCNWQLTLFFLTEFWLSPKISWKGVLYFLLLMQEESGLEPWYNAPSEGQLAGKPFPALQSVQTSHPYNKNITSSVAFMTLSNNYSGSVSLVKTVSKGPALLVDNVTWGGKPTHIKANEQLTKQPIILPQQILKATTGQKLCGKTSLMCFWITVACVYLCECVTEERAGPDLWGSGCLWIIKNTRIIKPKSELIKGQLYIYIKKKG